MKKPLDFNGPVHSDALWIEALNFVKGRIGQADFNLWLEPLKPSALQDDALVVEAPDSFSASWVQNHYGSEISAALQSLNPAVNRVIFIAKDSAGKAGQDASHATGSAQQNEPQIPAAASASTRRTGPGNNLNPLYTFDSFIIGENNRLAHAAALSISQSPGTAYNPLFIYGQVGVGKTHLMQAVGNFAKAQAGLRVVYLSSEQFLNEFIDSLLNKNTAAFRNRFRDLDLLLIDDIQFIGGKEETQREFFHTFNTLHDYHKQVVLSSDRPPKELKNLERRLVSRFEWGLVVDIQPPDLETRIAIIENKARLKNFSLPKEVAFCLAEKIEGNVRSLEGALTKLIACAGLYNKDVVDVVFTESILKDLFQNENNKPKIDITAIQEWVSRYYNIKISELKGDRRQQSLVLPRQIAIYLTRKLTGASLPQIGEGFGGKNHTTILYTCRKVEDKMSKDVIFKEEVERVLLKFKNDLNNN
ncbi:MAG: chromosomal replication initiator protein DnaA [Candidatus Omnitrophica bacterium]|nr:chromosomal replication initiator protein DnaA [Candidatus Omnitrophota bacterium]